MRNDFFDELSDMAYKMRDDQERLREMIVELDQKRYKFISDKSRESRNECVMISDWYEFAELLTRLRNLQEALDAHLDCANKLQNAR